MATCTRCGAREAAGFFDGTGLFVDTLSAETVLILGFKPICRPCAAVQVAINYDTSSQIGLDEEGKPEGDTGS
jgi:hypothetical protein